MSDMVAMLLLSASLCVSLGDTVLSGVLQREPVTLNDMFREVEELMEDTQHILEEAVDQITTESEKSSLTSSDLQLQVLDNTDQETNNRTGDSRLSHVHFEASAPWTGGDHECMVDEDCGELRYCLYEINNSRCLPCIPTDMPCTKDEECCTDQMCVWGQCTVNVTMGSEGTICHAQSDCRSDLCCAFQRELLFPVCNPRPGKGESCLNDPNLLMDMLAWDQDVPRDHCPCADHLQCRPHGRGSVCTGE